MADKFLKYELKKFIQDELDMEFEEHQACKTSSRGWRHIGKMEAYQKIMDFLNSDIPTEVPQSEIRMRQSSQM